MPRDDASGRIPGRLFWPSITNVGAPTVQQPQYLSLRHNVEQPVIPRPPPPPSLSAWMPPPPLRQGRFQTLLLSWWAQVSPWNSPSRAVRVARSVIVAQGAFTAAASAMALLLATVAAMSGAQRLPFAGLPLLVAAIGATLAGGMFIASAKLGLESAKARYITALLELLLIMPGIAFAAVGNYATEHAGNPANPGTDGPFADGADGLIGLMGIAYAAGGVVVIGLLLVAPTARRLFRRG